MILETNALKYRRGDGRRGDVHEKQNNFAGIGATGRGAPGDRFPDIKTGVHAQIQHLVAYSGETAGRSRSRRARNSFKKASSNNRAACAGRSRSAISRAVGPPTAPTPNRSTASPNNSALDIATASALTRPLLRSAPRRNRRAPQNVQRVCAAIRPWRTQSR